MEAATPQEEAEKRIRQKRFFQIVKRLPLELQLMVCLRAYGSPLDMTPAVTRELAFKTIADRISRVKIVQ